MRKPRWLRCGTRIVIRGEEWAISRRPPAIPDATRYPFWAARLEGERADWHGLLSWHGVAWGSHSKPAPPSQAFTDPSWVAVAWTAICIDPDEGMGFARKILEAAPGDDTPALIAADFVESRGASGSYTVSARIGPLEFDDILRAYRGEAPPAKSVVDLDLGLPEKVRSTPIEGPLGTWARAFVASTCIRCGYLRDGRDRVAIYRFETAWFLDKRPGQWMWMDYRRRRDVAADLAWPRCPTCGHSSDGRAPLPPLPTFDPYDPHSNGGQEP